MKIIFLDHQGVMFLKNHPNPGILLPFEKECVQILNDIIDKTGADIVISSDWKYWVSLEEMQKFYSLQGIKKPISYTGKTKNYSIKNMIESRSNEIISWLESNNEITNWVAIDDLNLNVKNFILTNSSLGLKQKAISDEIIKFLI